MFILVIKFSIYKSRVLILDVVKVVLQTPSSQITILDFHVKG